MEKIELNQPGYSKSNRTEKREKKPGTILLSGYWCNSADLIVRKLQEFDQQNKDTTIDKTLFLVKDRSLVNVGSGGYEFGKISQTLEKTLDADTRRKGRTNVEIIKDAFRIILEETAKNIKDDKEAEWLKEFFDYMSNNLSEGDKEEAGRSYQNLLDYSVVTLKESSVLNFLEKFLQLKGYGMKTLSSYKRIPRGHVEYKNISGVFALPDMDEEEIMKEISEE